MKGLSIVETFEAFIETIDNVEHREKLSGVFDWIDDHYPELKREIKWNQPMYTYNGTYIIGFSASKGHFAVAPEQATLSEFESQIKDAGYTYTKNLIRVKWDDDINYYLLKQLIDKQCHDKAAYTQFWR